MSSRLTNVINALYRIRVYRWRQRFGHGCAWTHQSFFDQVGHGDASSKGPQGRFGRLVENPEQGPGRAGRTARALFPVADGLLRYVDVLRKLQLGKSEPFANSAGMARHVLCRFFIVLPLLHGNVPFGGSVENAVVDPARRQAPRVVGIDPDAASCSWSGMSFPVVLLAETMRMAEPRNVLIGENTRPSMCRSLVTRRPRVIEMDHSAQTGSDVLVPATSSTAVDLRHPS